MTTTPSCCHRTNKAKVETSMPTNTPQNKRKNDPHCFLLSFLNTYTLSLRFFLPPPPTEHFIMTPQNDTICTAFFCFFLFKNPPNQQCCIGASYCVRVQSERERVHTVFPLKYNLTTISICIFTSAYSGPKLELNMFKGATKCDGVKYAPQYVIMCY